MMLRKYGRTAGLVIASFALGMYAARAPEAEAQSKKRLLEDPHLHHSRWQAGFAGRTDGERGDAVPREARYEECALSRLRLTRRSPQIRSSGPSATRAAKRPRSRGTRL